MNSPHFESILDKDLSFQYDKFVEEGIPFNKWQEQIQFNLKNQKKRKWYFSNFLSFSSKPFLLKLKPILLYDNKIKYSIKL